MSTEKERGMKCFVLVFHSFLLQEWGFLGFFHPGGGFCEDNVL